MATTKISSGISLSNTYFKRRFYTNNTDAMNKSKRSDFSKTHLSYEDSLALHNAAKKLKGYKYSDTDNEENVKSTIMAFVDTYNNTISSADDSTSNSKRYSKQLKSLVKKYSDELSDLGITVDSKGSLSANENLLKKASMEDINKVFGKDEKLTSSLYRITGKMSNVSYDDYYSSIISTSTKINLTV